MTIKQGITLLYLVSIDYNILCKYLTPDGPYSMMSLKQPIIVAILFPFNFGDRTRLNF